MASSPIPHDTLRLRAGPLSLTFDPESAFVRDIRLGDREVLRGVYAAARDADWGTVSPSTSDVQLHQEAAAFTLSFHVRAAEGDIDFAAWQGRLSGTAEGTLRFEIEGEARTPFRSNRIGFCVLHPAVIAGQPCSVEHTDGTVERGRFPRWIAPHQPFFDVRAVTYESAPGITATVRCEGDVFEMEDQRNWTDASFKTYCTPLARPFPVDVAAGTRVRQSVELTLSGLKTADVKDTRDDAAPVRVAGVRGVLAPRDAALPDAFSAAPGTVFPVYHVLADVRAWRGRPLLRATSSAPRAVAVLAVQEDEGVGLLLGNATPEVQRVEVHLPGVFPRATVRTLDAATERDAAHQPEAFRPRPDVRHLWRVTPSR